MTARISRSLLIALADAARSSPSVEICGLLVGAGGNIREAVPATNVAAHPTLRFEIDPATLFAALRAERGGGPEVIGCYHSHPGGDAAPSRQDAADAAPDGRYWLIIGRDECGLWRAVPHGTRFGRFDPVPHEIDPAFGLHDAPRFSKRPGDPHIRSLDA